MRTTLKELKNKKIKLARPINQTERISDEDLFEKALKNPIFFESLMNRYKNAFIRKINPIMFTVGGLNGVEDVIQETFVKIYIKGRSFKSRGKGSFRSWAYAVLLNTCYSALRSAKRQKTVSIDGIVDTIVDIPEPVDEKEKILSMNYIYSMLSRLPETLKKTADLYFLEGKSHKEIAMAENTTEGAIRTRIHRARSEMKKINNDIIK